MSLLDKLRRRVAGSTPSRLTPASKRADPTAKRSGGHGHSDDRREDALRARLHDDPNDESAFTELAGIVRRRAAEGHTEDDPRRAEDDAVWALAEEMAGSSRAWYPLLELGRLSIHDDREGAMRRLSTAAERDPSGGALASALAILREEGLPGDALGLGVGHWRPREHRIDAGSQLVHAAVEAGRVGEARRHLEALSAHPDSARVEVVRAELERVIAGAEDQRPH
ncbi:hypothetical protein WDV85_10625 [Pseudokineococcus sp. 5B2Z-1]|uniref:hypothetical protein n=1 Tax=Pseudokineococcus sp. 5B2Z-1 TaxID=3132744 RepID=UPI00262D8600|nr:hypothetical protein [uncultured Pseudokineococcus sp.]